MIEQLKAFTSGSELAALIATHAEHAQAKVLIRLHVERLTAGRKPFLFAFKTPGRKQICLSATRAAMMLTILFDLGQRSVGGRGIANTKKTAVEVLSILESDNSAVETLAESSRVAWYRFGDLWKEEFSALFDAELDICEGRLRPLVKRRYEIEIYSTDPQVEETLPALGAAAMLERLRYERALFVPSGGSGGERFLKELYATEGRLEVVSAYARPQMLTIPPELFGKYIQSPEALERYELMHRRLALGTLSCTEIINESALDALIEEDSSGRFQMGMPVEDVLCHLQYLERLIKAGTGFRLILTRAEIPFYVACYRAKELEVTAFFRLPLSDGVPSDYSCLAMWGEHILSLVRNSVLNWLIEHPATISDPDEVCSKIKALQQKLIAKLPVSV